MHAITLKRNHQLRLQTQVAANMAATKCEHATRREELRAHVSGFVRVHLFNVKPQSRTQMQQIQRHARNDCARASFFQTESQIQIKQKQKRGDW